jgi:hypothetical protein
MKLLRNPWVTAGLVVTAICVVGYQVYPVSGIRARTPQSPTPRPVQANSLPPRIPDTATQNVKTVEQPETSGVDRAYIQARLDKWLNAPARDPFWLVPQRLDKAGAKALASPIPRWKLRGIWSQTGGRVAAINDRVYTEGDIIDGYRIERIEDDQVWFQGPDRHERLGFGSPTPGKSEQAGATR